MGLVSRLSFKHRDCARERDKVVQDRERGITGSARVEDCALRNIDDGQEEESTR